MKRILFVFIVIFSFFYFKPHPIRALESANLDSGRMIIKFKSLTPKIYRDSLFKSYAFGFTERLMLPDTYVVMIPKGQFSILFNRLQSNLSIEYVEEDYLTEAVEIPNDEYYSRQWGLEKIKSPGAWDKTHGNPAVKIAIIDTGIDGTHPDLGSRVVAAVNCTVGSGCPVTTSQDKNGHGSHVAGIASAITNNGLGVAGVSWEGQLLSVKALDDSGSGYSSWLSNAIYWAADNGAKVINISLGSTYSSYTLQKAIDYAWGKGVVVVAAAGNNGSSRKFYPAYYSNAIAVAATGQDDFRASFSNYGSWVDVAAPGISIYSTYKGGYEYLSGTSMSAPFVTGLAALVFGQNPSWSNGQVRNKIESTEASPSADPVSTPTPEVVNESPTPTPTPTQPPYWSDEYDVWKEQKNLEDDAREVRDDEWEAHEDDQTWVSAHGGNKEYYVSGNWQKDEDARIAAEAAAAAAAAEATAAQSPDSLMNDPCTSTENAGFGEAGSSSTGSVDSLAQAAGSTTTDVNNNNCLAMENSGTAAGVSGENSQILNDGSVDMTTGASSADGTIVNTGNANTTDTSGAGGGATSATTGESLLTDSGGETLTQGVTAENLNTGEDTNNLAEASNSETLGVVNTNEAYVNNELNVQGTSGANVITENDGDATLTTGDIELIANMLNILNLNITGEDFMHLIINIFGTLNADLDIDDIASALGLKSDDELQVIAQNNGTGEGSTNTANASNTETTAINNDNTAVVNNTMNVDGVSGQNDVSGNEGNIDVVTGRIKILANLMNFINANFSGEKWSFIMVNIFGKLTGDIILPDTSNYTDGATGNSAVAENVSPNDGTASSQATTSDTTNVSNANNVSLTNDVNANGISGENTENGNDGAGTTQSGEVDVLTKLVNYLNFNITGNNWVFLVVNVFGKWMGKIVNFAGSDMNAPTDGSFAALSVGQSSDSASLVQSSNNGGSDNTATATNTSETNVNNQNSATVSNDLNINGVSGQNGLNGNDGSTSLTTGWVDIDANLLNIINMNVTGRSWMIVFLNIFGDFTGNLFFGPKPVPAKAPFADNTITVTKDNVDDFSMGESSGSSDNGNSSTGGGLQSSSTASVSQNTGVVTVIGVQSTAGKRKVKRIIPRSLNKNFVYYSDIQIKPVDEGMYFSLFGKKIRISGKFKKFFSRLALKGNILLARN